MARRAPVGPEAARRMAEALSPDQFTLIKMDHPRVEAVLVRSSLLQMLDQKILMDIVLDECDRLILDTMVLRSELNIAVSVHREVELG